MKKETKKTFKQSFKRHRNEIKDDQAKMQASLERIKQLPESQKKKVQKAMRKMPKALREAAEKLFSE